LSLAVKGDDIGTCYQEKAKKDAKKLKSGQKAVVFHSFSGVAVGLVFTSRENVVVRYQEIIGDCPQLSPQLSQLSRFLPPGKMWSCGIKK